MTEACTRQLFAAHPNAKCTMQVIPPNQMGVKRIGHSGAFKRDMQAIFSVAFHEYFTMIAGHFLWLTLLQKW